MGRFLIVIGIILVFVGVLWAILGKFIPTHLPGDIIISRGRFTVYFPLCTCILLSIILIILLFLVKK